MSVRTQLYARDTLRKRQTETPPKNEIECHESGELMSVPKLLYGLALAEHDTLRMSIE